MSCIPPCVCFKLFEDSQCCVQIHKSMYKMTCTTISLDCSNPHILLVGTLVSFVWIIISQIFSGWKSHVCEIDWGRKRVFTVIKLSEWTKNFNFFLSPVHLLRSRLMVQPSPVLLQKTSGWRNWLSFAGCMVISYHLENYFLWLWLI